MLTQFTLNQRNPLKIVFIVIIIINIIDNFLRTVPRIKETADLSKRTMKKSKMSFSKPQSCFP